MVEKKARHSTKLYISIAAQIRSWIENGELRPGDRLPPLAELADVFHCSRATVREALSALRGQGLVEFRHGDGTYVRTASIDMWMEPLDAALLLGVSHAEQMIELLATVLMGIAGVAAQRRSEATLVELAQALFRVECADAHAEDAVLAEVAFYLSLAECTGNILFENILRVCQESLRSYLRMVQAEEKWEGVNICRRLYDAVQSKSSFNASAAAADLGASLQKTLGTRRSE